MVRALLREDQIGDKDNLSEYEHDVLVHENLVTSGTVTLSGGVDAAGTIEFVSAGDENLYIRNNSHGGKIFMTGENDAGAAVNLTSFDPGGACILHYQGNTALTTVSDGIKIQDPGSSYDFRIRQNGSDWNLYAFNPDGTPIRISATNDSDAETTVAAFDPDGAAELYYAGDKTVETTATSGINVVNEVTAVTYYGDGSNLTGISGTHTHSQLYYKDSLAFEAKDDPDEQGVIVYNDYSDYPNDGFAIYAPKGPTPTEWNLYSFEPGSEIFIRGRTTTTSGAVVITKFDPDAGPIFFNSGTEVAHSVSTTASGGMSFTNNDSPGAMYLGEENTDGSWRFIVIGDDLIIQRRVSGTWTTKTTVPGA